MRALLQRVQWATVVVADETIARIDRGLLVFLGVMHGDDATVIPRLVEKILGLRIFADQDGKMNCSVRDIGGAILLVSQFTLGADCRKGRRPSFTDAAPPELANALYEATAAAFRASGVPTQTGRFAAEMQIELLNDGPVTIWLDTAEW